MPMILPSVITTEEVKLLPSALKSFLRSAKGVWVAVVFSLYPGPVPPAIQHQDCGNARYHGSKCRAVPSCCRRAGCCCNYDLCGGLSAHAVFCRKNPGRILHRPTGGSSGPGLCTLSFSFRVSHCLLYKNLRQGKHPCALHQLQS